MREFGQKLGQEKKQLTEPLALGMLEVYYRCRFFLVNGSDLERFYGRY